LKPLFQGKQDKKLINELFIIDSMSELMIGYMVGQSHLDAGNNENSYVLGQYIEFDFAFGINLFHSADTVVLENVRLKTTAIPTCFAVKVKQGILGRVVISLPLFQLSSKPIKVYVEDISIVLELKDDNDISRNDLLKRLDRSKKNVRTKLEEYFANEDSKNEDSRNEEEEAILGEGEKEVDNNYNSDEKGKNQKKGFDISDVPNFLKNVIKNVSLHLGNIHIRLEQKLDKKAQYKDKVNTKCDELNSDRCNAIGLCIQSFDLLHKNLQ